MSNFPMGIMKKNLKRETANEVDNSPNIFNAKDFNIHDRELLSIQRYLVGDGLGKPNSGIIGVLAETVSQVRDISNNGLIAQYTGSVAPGQRIALPSNISQTTTVGVNTGAAATINVTSTADFPSSGYITKFNNISSTATGSPPYYHFLFSSMSNQEIIKYTGKTSTSFTGCTRSVEGTAQDTTVSENAVILGGKASFFICLKSFVTLFSSSNVPIQTLVQHDSSLKVSGDIISLGLGTQAKTIQIGYSLFTVGSF